MRRWLPARKSLSGEYNEVEKIAKYAEETHCRYGVFIDNITDDVVVSFSITDTTVCSDAGSRGGSLHKSLQKLVILVNYRE